MLPVEIPVPVAQGRPSGDYPWFWDIHTWVEGETVPIEEVDPIRAAHDLAGLVGSLQQVNPEGAPPGRGIPLSERDDDARYWLARFNGDPAVAAEWERALAAPPSDGPPVWHHGDLDARNWLVREGRITGVIDWDMMGVGDPACDVMVAWKLHSSAARDAFREALPTDDATWERARGWVYRRQSQRSPTTHREQPDPVPRGRGLAQPGPLGSRVEEFGQQTVAWTALGNVTEPSVVRYSQDDSGARFDGLQCRARGSDWSGGCGRTCGASRW